MNGDDARIVCEGDVNLLWIGPKYSENMPGGIVTKPPKPVSSVSAVPTWGVIRNFFQFCPGVAAFIEGVIFLRSALIVVAVLKGEVGLQNH
jgi:hypothetical protein